ncbi:MAG: phosphoribosyltransferase family protein [Nocardioidaceae bacterium]
MPFTDRVDAGRRLAARLSHLAGEDVVVLGLPRGGVPVAFEVARALAAPLDVLVVRKLGVPFQPELAMGAVGEGGVTVHNERILDEARITVDELATVEQRERAEVDRRVPRFRSGAPTSLAGRTAVVVDDGIATGSTARAACQIARAKGADRVVLATPVAPPDRVASLRGDADEVVCLETPAYFVSIGSFYDDFSQTSDEEVVDLLTRAAATDRDEEVQVAAGPLTLSGHLTLPAGARGMVVFAHGSGSSRHSPRNRYVATRLNRDGLGTLLFDLLTAEEELDRAKVFDIELLGERLLVVTRWAEGEEALRRLPIGYFGASTGAAAALSAAARLGGEIRAVVSRGGRPDLAAESLEEVASPTLLIVGGADWQVLELNEQAAQLLRCEHEVAVVPGATHLFEEPGALERVAELAADWFSRHLPITPRRDG